MSIEPSPLSNQLLVALPALHDPHFARSVALICQHDGDGAMGVVINRPPRDGRMAFVRSPDNVSVELLQKGAAQAPAEPWASMASTGTW